MSDRTSHLSRPPVPTAKNLLVLSTLVSACDGGTSPSILFGVSDDADRITRLWWVMLGISVAVFLVVVVFIVRSITSHRPRPDTSPDSERRSHRWVLWGGLIGPAVVLVVVWVLVVIDMRALADDDDGANLVVEVTGKQWWWDVVYPDLGVRTANEIHIPAGEPVKVRVTSADVQHSFWVPQAGPKRDMYPTLVNDLEIEVERPGVYTGICSEFCGLQHAKMYIVLVAHRPGEFTEWAEHQAGPAEEPDSEEAVAGREVFLQSNCVGCHSIRGVSEVSDRGPDLTHLADRSLIAADPELGLESLQEFVRDPHRLKPGVLMPPADLSETELDSLTAYLKGLR